MKKFVLCAFVFAVLGCVNVFAANPTVSISDYEGIMETIYSGGIKNSEPPAIILYINGDIEGSANAVIKNGTTLVPIRVISERLGADVSWDNETKTVSITKDSLEITCKIGENFVLAGGKEIAITNPAEIIDSKTYLPLRAISSAYGAKVGYFDDISEKIRIITVDEKDFNEITEDNAVRIAENAYFYDFLPSMREYISEVYNVDIDTITKANISKTFGFPKYSGKVTRDMGHYWYVEFFEGSLVGALVDKETGDLYPTHSFSLVEFSVSDVGDYSGWGWSYQ